MVSTHLTHLSPGPQSMLNGENIPSDAASGVGVEEQENPVVAHVAPVSTGPGGPSRLGIQHVLSLWISGSAG